MTKLNKFLLLNIFIVILFTGCTPPSAIAFFKDDKLKASAIQYTKKADITYKGEVEAILNATYLNSVNEDFEDENQNFIVGVYITRDNRKDENRFLNNKNFTISMNGKKPIYLDELHVQHKMYGHLPLYNNWAKYYLVKFEAKEDEENLEIELHSKKHKKSAIISFEAE